MLAQSAAHALAFVLLRLSAWANHTSFINPKGECQWYSPFLFPFLLAYAKTFSSCIKKGRAFQRSLIYHLFKILKLSLRSKLSKLTKLTTIALAIVHFASSLALISIVVRSALPLGSSKNFERSDNFANFVNFKDI